jgi:hypothetical protein
MSNQVKNRADPVAFASYWLHLRQNVLDHPQRVEVLRTVLDLDYYVVTTGYLAQTAERRLQNRGLCTSFDRSDLNRFLGHLERTGVVFRVPKLSNDDHYLVVLDDWVRQWFDELDFDSQTPSRYPGGVASYVARYLGRSFTRTEFPSGERLPQATASIEATLYAFFQRYRVEPTDITVSVGSLDRVEQVTDALRHPSLDLGVDLPGSDDQWGGGKRVHDYAVVFEVDGLHDEPPSQLCNGVRTWLLLVVGAAITGYLTLRTDGTDDAVGRGEVSKGVVEFLNPEEPDEAVDRARRRIGHDVSYDESEARMIAGCYFRRKMPKTNDEQ